jgi:hypothetical protein
VGQEVPERDARAIGGGCDLRDDRCHRVVEAHAGPVELGAEGRRRDHLRDRTATAAGTSCYPRPDLLADQWPPHRTRWRPDTHWHPPEGFEPVSPPREGCVRRSWHPAVHTEPGRRSARPDRVPLRARSTPE